MGGKTINLAVLLSGGGRTLQNLIDREREGSLDARIKVVISSSRKARGLKRAESADIPAFCVEYGKYSGSEEFADKIYDYIEGRQIDLVVLAGFMHLFTVKEGWEGRVMNIHPALIPSFCGRGYYGEKVHRAAIDYGVKITGCTVHFVDREYDRGPIILQAPVPVKDNDTPEILAERVFREECKLYPEAIRLFGKGLLKIKGRRVDIENES